MLKIFSDSLLGNKKYKPSNELSFIILQVSFDLFKDQKTTHLENLCVQAGGGSEGRERLSSTDESSSNTQAFAPRDTSSLSIPELFLYTASLSVLSEIGLLNAALKFREWRGGEKKRISWVLFLLNP